jgi:type IV pilus assembly protein PilY1
VAKYYYDNDLRTVANANCSGAISGVNVCDEIDPNGVLNTAFTKQSMVTFTLGLGLDGERIYDPDYKTASTGDYAKIKAGTLSWPVPAQNSATAIDDLWHAAVNGEGTYFSAKDPQQLVKSLTETLRDVGARTGGGAAAALSSQKPIVGNNSSYSASYTSKKWTGNLEKYEIDLVTGNFNTTPAWCVEDVVNDSSCASPNTVEAETVSGTTSYYCVDTTSTTASCSGANSTFSGTTCKTKLAEACTGVFKNQAARNIFMATYTSTSNVLDIFEDAKLTTDQKAYFGSANLATALSQWSTFTTDQQNTAASTNIIINYLRGAKGYEDSANNASQDRLFRKRDAVLGDIVNSTPIYAGRTKASYSDPGFGPAGLTGSFSNLMASRAGTVYVGANDGMLHAFNEANGAERWAFIPTAVLPNIAKIADSNWDTNHLNFVNGDGVINDICIATDCTTATGADWRTIYVGGLASGGKGYYALDITDPDNPKLLWEFGATAEYAGDTSFDEDIGLSYGNPMVVKNEDGKWVVLLTSGYNNTAGTNAGKGFLYVVDAYTGEKISKIGTGSGTATDPSGLAKISAFVDDSDINNTANYVYGGDLDGKVWRFSLTDETVLLLAELKDATGTKQPITSAPAIGKRDNKRMLFVGTGRYLGINDLTNTQQQSFYAIEDDDETTTLTNYRSSGALVNKNLSVTSGTRAIGNTASIDWSNKRGWFVDYIDSGERQNLPADIVLGAVLVPTVVPSNAACTPGGYGYLNVFDSASGNPLASNPISMHFNSPIVGYNVMALSDGRVIVNVRT